MAGMEEDRRYGSQRRIAGSSLADFIDMEVRPRLVDSGSFSRKDYQHQFNQTTSYMSPHTSRQQIIPGSAETRAVTSYSLTPKGEAAREELELRMAAVLQVLKQERPSWVDEKPQQALMAAMIAVAAGRPEPTEEAELQLVTQLSEQGASTDTVPQESAAYEVYQPVWFDWTIYDSFERTYAEVDSGCDVGGGEGGGW